MQRRNDSKGSNRSWVDAATVPYFYINEVKQPILLIDRTCSALHHDARGDAAELTNYGDDDE